MMKTDGCGDHGNAVQVQKQLDRFVRALERHGYRVTGARRAVLAALVGCGGHVSADDLAARLHDGGEKIGRMTVYRTLDLLSSLGIIRPVYQGTGAAHYILMDDGHHHHLVCTTCARTIEFDECALAGMSEQLGRRFDFRVEGHLLEFFGVCADCQ
jgi:Fur family ferric uptake transcriptional regulator